VVTYCVGTVFEIRYGREDRRNNIKKEDEGGEVSSYWMIFLRKRENTGSVRRKN
jgi:hypothetical protein